MNGFAALDIHPHRRYVVNIGGRRSSRCRLHINFALFLHSLDFTQNLGVTQFSVQQIFILVYLLPQLFPLSAPADFRQQAVAFHKSEDGFGILVAAVLVQPELHSAIAVGILTPFLLTCNLIYDCLIRVWLAQSLNIRIIPASGNAKESAHPVNRMVLPVTVYYSIFYPVAHSLSMDCRKSRSNSFSIFKRSFSAL